MMKNISDVEKYNNLSNYQIINKIQKLKKEKNAIILAHFYVDAELQDIADHVGDSLALAFIASKTSADIILFIGVHFMAETAKILSPDKKILMPDPTSGCPLADSLSAGQLERMREQYPEHMVVSYVNTSAEVKALSDVICTSSNAIDIVSSMPQDTPIIFGPDMNLGSYVRGMTNRDMVIWRGSCPVHMDFSYDKLLELKQKYPDAAVLAHPECNKQILLKADYIGSTSKIVKLAQELEAKRFIIATEPGVIHQMQKLAPDKEYIPLPRSDDKQSFCINMRKHTLAKALWALDTEIPEVLLSEDLIERAYKPIKRMLDISEQLGLLRK